MLGSEMVIFLYISVEREEKEDTQGASSGNINCPYKSQLRNDEYLYNGYRWTFEKILRKFDGIQRRIAVLSPGKVVDNI